MHIVIRDSIFAICIQQGLLELFGCHYDRYHPYIARFLHVAEQKTFFFDTE